MTVACGYRELPPPTPPARTFPSVSVPPAPPEEGEARVVLDANGERAMVTEVTAWTSSTGWIVGGSTTLEATTDQEHPVCLTPCVTAFSRGLHLLRFKSQSDSRTSDVAIQLDDRSKVVRHAMARVEEGPSAANIGGAVMIALGVTALIAGSLMFVESGSANALPSEARNEQTAGAALLVGAGGAFALSIPLFLLGRGTRQPGATTEFEF